jgi:hypothetical protein
MPTTLECMLFSDNAYGKPQGALEHNLVNSWKRIQLPFPSAMQDNPLTGFRAHVYHNERKKEVVITFSGTHLYEKKDREACRDIFMGRLPTQFGDASNLYRAVDRYIQGKGIQAQISFTGHSLGGALAQYMAIEAQEQGCPAVSFGGPGVLHALGELRSKYNPGYSYPVVNHVALGDEFANFGRHVGKVNYYSFEHSGGAQADSRLPEAIDDYELARRFILSLYNHPMKEYFKELQQLERSSYRGKVRTTYQNGVAYREVYQRNWTGGISKKIRVPR